MYKKCNTKVNFGKKYIMEKKEQFPQMPYIVEFLWSLIMFIIFHIFQSYTNVLYIIIYDIIQYIRKTIYDTLIRAIQEEVYRVIDNCKIILDLLLECSFQRNFSVNIISLTTRSYVIT
jgi:hypothetical protein